MDPMPGAIDTVYKFAEYYDIYILSTAHDMERTSSRENGFSSEASVFQTGRQS